MKAEINTVKLFDLLLLHNFICRLLTAVCGVDNRRALSSSDSGLNLHDILQTGLTVSVVRTPDNVRSINALSTPA